jgi:hypothetical protein
VPSIDEAEQLSALIDDIYDASLDPARRRAGISDAGAETSRPQVIMGILRSEDASSTQTR